MCILRAVKFRFSASVIDALVCVYVCVYVCIYVCVCFLDLANIPKVLGLPCERQHGQAGYSVVLFVFRVRNAFATCCPHTHLHTHHHTLAPLAFGCPQVGHEKKVIAVHTVYTPKQLEAQF